MRELDFVSPGQETVEYGGDFTLEDELAVDESDFLFRHLCLSSSSSLLLSVRSRAIMFEIFLGFLVLCES